MNSTMKMLYRAGLMCSACTTLPAVAVAEVSGGGGQSLEEIVVTAQKRAENLQDVPISVTAFAKEDLAVRRIEGVADLGVAVPGLFTAPISSTSTGQRLYIRGLGNVDTTISIDSKVAVYLDGIYSGKAVGLVFDQVDLDRVEVLKGPQGTLYGRNAVGGAINFIPRKASTDRLYGEAEVGFGNYDSDDFKGVLNVPLSDTFAVKLAGVYRQQDGWVKNLGPGTDLMGYERWAARADVMWHPAADLTFTYAYDQSHSRDLPSYSQPVPTNTPGFLVLLGAAIDPPSASRKSTVTTTSQIVAQPSYTDTNGSTFVGAWNWADDQTLSLRAGYRGLTSRAWFAQTVSQNPAGIAAFATGLFLGGGLPPATAAALGSQYSSILVSADGGSLSIEDNHYSFELNQVGSFGSRVKYVSGLYYFNENVASPYGPNNRPARVGDLVDLLFANADGTSLFRGATVNTNSYAAFTQFTWTPPVLEDQLRLILGGRYSIDDRTAVIQRLAPGSYEPVINGVTIDPTPLAADFHSFNPSFIVQYDFSPGVMGYASVVSGYQSGGFNINGDAGSLAYDPKTVNLSSLIYNSEKITAYEIGTKSDFLDKHLRVDAAFFYYDLPSDQQTVSGANLTQRAIVDTKSTYKGGEIEIIALPTRDLQLGVQWAYLDAHSNPFPNPFIPGFIVQPTNAGAPRNSYTASIDYGRPLPISSMDIALHAEFDHRDSSKPNDATALNAANILNARIALGFNRGPHTRYELALWGQNLTDDQYQVDSTSFAAFAYDTVTYGTPRTFGVTANAKF
jgi:iron complex outermembrane receptor protein